MNSPLLLSLLITFLWTVNVLGSLTPEARGNGITQATYDDLVRYTKYSSAAYHWFCFYPLGNKLVEKFRDSGAGTQGFVVRDDGRKEIVVAFQGTFDLADVLVDIQIILKPLKSIGLTDVGVAEVHTGFLSAYNAVASDVLRIVAGQLSSYPSYRVVVTGHSLGGATASLAAISIRAAHPSVPMQLYTFGQPRTGNAAFASYVEKSIGINNIFRAVHTHDGIPTALPKSFGYRHFATEYWNFQDPPSVAYTRQCSGGDDPTCSDSIPSDGLNLPHFSYFGQAMAFNPLLCLFE